jgi:hypothetical protein
MGLRMNERLGGYGTILAVLAAACAAPTGGEADDDVGSTAQSLSSWCGAAGVLSGPDNDFDGIADVCEQSLAERYAPIVYHSSDESNFPTNVDWFLPKTSLWFYDDNCLPDLKQKLEDAPPQSDLSAWWYRGGCGASDTVLSGGTRSDNKQRTFFLGDVASQFRSGSPNTSDWVTYVHAYRNTGGGITIQYWRFYAYNDAANDHGGDWEGAHVILDSTLNPSSVLLLGHDGVERHAPGDLVWEGTHPRVFSEGGGHATHTSGSGIQARCRVCLPFGGCISVRTCTVDPSNPDTFVRQETFPFGLVTGNGRAASFTGPLLNVGEKLSPINGQSFIKYSGIWGSPGSFFFTSGYWGPVFNETAMGANHFITAWCDGMANQPAGECFPSATSR